MHVLPLFHQNDQHFFFSPSGVTPFSYPLSDNLFVFVGTLYMYADFIPAEKSTPTFQQSDVHIIIYI